MSTTTQSPTLESTRGLIITALRRGAATVTELTAQLRLSTNAVRVQLARMERDGLVRRTGTQRRTTRPSVLYELTPGAHQLLSRAYIPFLTHFLRAAVGTYSPSELKVLMRNAGKSLAEDFRARVAVDGSLAARAASASTALNIEFGALTEVVKADGGLDIRGHGCPLAAATGKHRVVCLAMESFVSEIVGQKVIECCSLQEPPQCCFQIRRERLSPRGDRAQ